MAVDDINAAEPLLPSISALDGVLDPAVRTALQAMKEILEVRLGKRPNASFLDRAVTYRDMYRGGIASVVVNGELVSNLEPDNSVIAPAPTPIDTSIVGAPIGFIATGTKLSVLLEWDTPADNVSYTEVWRATFNNIGLAVMVGTTPSTLYADILNASNVTRYYWIRHVSSSGIAGDYNSISGTIATTGGLASADLISVDGAKIIDATILNAKISNVSADKIITGTMVATEVINVGTGSDRMVIDGDGNIRAGATGYDTGTGMWQGLDGGQYKLFIGNSAANKMLWDGTNLLLNSDLTNELGDSRVVISVGDVVSGRLIGGVWYDVKALSRVEAGVTANNSTVVLAGYFTEEPYIIVSPANVGVYKAANSAVDQTLSLQAKDIDNILNWDTAAIGAGLSTLDKQLIKDNAATWGIGKGVVSFQIDKWYWEVRVDVLPAAGRCIIGIGEDTATLNQYVGQSAFAYGYRDNANKANNATFTAYGASLAVNDVVGIAYDGNAKTLTFLKNGVSQGVAFTGFSGAFRPMVSLYQNAKATINFGEAVFAYAIPAGYVALAEFIGAKQTFKFKALAQLILNAGNSFVYISDNVTTAPSTTVYTPSRTTNSNVALIVIGGTAASYFTTVYTSGNFTFTKKEHSTITVYMEYFSGGVWVNGGLVYTKAGSSSVASWNVTYLFPSSAAWLWRLRVVTGAPVMYYNTIGSYHAAPNQLLAINSLQEQITADTLLAAGTMNYTAIGK
jgi:hypothetical protein